MATLGVECQDAAVPQDGSSCTSGSQLDWRVLLLINDLLNRLWSLPALAWAVALVGALVVGAAGYLTASGACGRWKAGALRRDASAEGGSNEEEFLLAQEHPPRLTRRPSALVISRPSSTSAAPAAPGAAVLAIPVEPSVQIIYPTVVPALPVVASNKSSPSAGSTTRASNIASSVAACPELFPYPLEGMRMNNFAGIPVDFRRELYSKLTEKQKAAFGNFEAKVKSQLDLLVRDKKIDTRRFWQRPDEFTLLRFLQADNYNVDMATARMCETVLWRQRIGLDDFITTLHGEADPKAIGWCIVRKYRQLRIRRFLGDASDSQGRPIIVERLGSFLGSDVAYKCMKPKHVLLSMAFDMSEVLANCRNRAMRGEGYHHRFSFLADIAGVRYSLMTKTGTFLIEAGKPMAANFPELAGPVTAVNLPYWAYAVYNGVVKHFLAPSVVENIALMSGAGHKECLKRHGPNIPKEFGGESDIDYPPVPTTKKEIEALDALYPIDDQWTAYPPICEAEGTYV